jgi:hypothetical protein
MIKLPACRLVNVGASALIRFFTLDGVCEQAVPESLEDDE